MDVHDVKKQLEDSLSNLKSVKGQLKTSEGVSRTRSVEYTIEGWTKNFTDYLKSAMSYTDKNNLYFFTGTADIIQVSDNAFKRYNK